MIVKYVADATQNFLNFVLIDVSADEIHAGINTSEQLDLCKVEKAIPNAVSVRDLKKISYEEKLNECMKRVYSCDYSQKPKSAKKLDKKIDRSIRKTSSDMNGDVDNLILTATGYFGFPPYVADRTKLIMARMWSYPDNFHGLKYENVVLGILMFVVYEDLGEDKTIDFSNYCTLLLGTAQAERNIKQMYQAYEIVKDLYKEVEREFQTGAQQVWALKRKLYIQHA